MEESERSLLDEVDTLRQSHKKQIAEMNERRVKEVLQQTEVRVPACPTVFPRLPRSRPICIRVVSQDCVRAHTVVVQVWTGAAWNASLSFRFQVASSSTEASS